MRRAFIAAVVAGCLHLSAFAQVDPAEPPPADRPNARPEAAQVQKIQEQITDFYLSDFRNELGLTEEQFFSLNQPLRQFMRMRFQAPARRQEMNQRLDQLLSQPNPPEAEVQKLTKEIAQFDRQMGNQEERFLAAFGSELSTRQQAQLLQFNRRFFNEKLPGLIRQARERNAAQAQRQAQQKQQQQRQKPAADPVRPNNTPVARPGNALRGKPNQGAVGKGR
jgi:chromosome segregation ATPase